jgi:sugar lactone lactonase YvrE
MAAADGATVMPWAVAVAAGAELGERPVWDATSPCLIWVDIGCTGTGPARATTW